MLVGQKKIEGEERAHTPRMVKRRLIKRSAPQPRSRKTPRGGSKTAKMILQMSEPVKGMLMVLFV